MLPQDVDADCLCDKHEIDALINILKEYEINSQNNRAEGIANHTKHTVKVAVDTC